MEVGTWAVVVVAAAAYMAWFWRLSRGLSGPRVWPVLGSLPGLVQHAEEMHEWIVGNLRRTGGTYQTCIFAVPGVARRGGLVTCDPRNLEHVLKALFDNYPKGPFWHAVFRDLLGDGIFNSDGETWVAQRKTAALEFTTRTLRTAMSRWVSRSIHLRLLPILEEAASGRTHVDLQDLLRLTFDNICGQQGAHDDGVPVDGAAFFELGEVPGPIGRDRRRRGLGSKEQVALYEMADIKELMRALIAPPMQQQAAAPTISFAYPCSGGAVAQQSALLDATCGLLTPAQVLQVQSHLQFLRRPAAAGGALAAVATQPMKHQAPAPAPLPARPVSKLYRGVRQRHWGKWVAEIRLPREADAGSGGR